MVNYQAIGPHIQNMKQDKQAPVHSLQRMASFVLSQLWGQTVETMVWCQLRTHYRSFTIWSLPTSPVSSLTIPGLHLIL